MPGTDLSYEEWIDYVFDRTDLASGQAWYFDHEADWWNPQPEQAVAYLARLFDNPEPLLGRFVDNQIGRGLQYLVDNSNSNHCLTLSDSAVPIDQRAECIYAMLSLFIRIFEPRCLPILSHLDEKRGNRLNGVCYMWWDIMPLAAMSKPRNSDPIHDACLAVMRNTLALPNLACQESALHGLGHWAHAYPEFAAATIDAYLAANPKLRPELARYAQAARSGRIQ
jgi:hypothetical protein